MRNVKNTPSTSTVQDGFQVQRIIEAVPSRHPLLSATCKLATLVAQRAETVKEIDRLSKEEASGKDQPAARAEVLLSGGELSSETVGDALRDARRKLAVINEAESMLRRTIRELTVKFSQEVNVALKSARQVLVSRMATAIQDLRAAASEDARLREELGKGGVDLTHVDSLTFLPIGGGCDFSLGWEASRKAEGYTV